MLRSKNIFKISIIARYVLKEFLITFLITFLFYLVMFIINFILVHIRDLIRRDVPFHLIIKLILTYFPFIINFSLPFGILLSTLMTMGRFSSDNEIIAFRAHGINIMRVFTPIFLCSFIITLITFYINDRSIPDSFNQRAIVLRQIINIKPTLNLKSKTVKKHDNKTIYTNIVDKDHIEGLLIIDKDVNNDKRIITAKNAEINLSNKSSGIIELKLKNSMQQLENRDRPNEFNYGYSDVLNYYIDLHELSRDAGNRNEGYHKYTLENYKDIKKYSKVFKKEKIDHKINITQKNEEIKQVMNSNIQYLYSNITKSKYNENLNIIDNNINDQVKIIDKKLFNSGLNDNLIEFFRKFTNPIACFIFAIFAAPVGIYSRRSGYQIGFIIGLFVATLYWFSSVITLTLGKKMLLPPFIVFLPNIFFLIVGIFAMSKRLKE